MDVTDFDFDALARRLQVIAFLLPGVTVQFNDSAQEKGPRKDLSLRRRPGRVRQVAQRGPQGRSTASPWRSTGSQNGVAVEVVFQWHTSVDDSEIVSFVNTIPTPDGGKHVAGFKSAVTKAINQFASEKKLVKEKGEASIRGATPWPG